MSRLPTGTDDSSSLSCSVLVVSCDRYRDLWKPFFELFHRFWRDCPFPVYLGSNFAGADQSGVAVLHSGEDISWSANLRVLLQQIPSDYVLLLLEDFFLDRAVDSAAIKSALELLHSLDGTVMRLCPKPPSDYALPNEASAGVLHRMAPYRVSLQAALWNKAKLMTLLRDGESSWEFEWKGTERSRAEASGYYCVKRAAVRYQHVVERGEWFWWAARRYGRAGIGCDLAARPVMHPAQALKKKVANWARRLRSWALAKWLYASDTP